jgi:hypothetical protein
MSSNSEEEDDEEYFNRDQDDFNDVNQSLMFSKFSDKSIATEKIKKDQKKASLPTYDCEAIIGKMDECKDQFELLSK